MSALLETLHDRLRSGIYRKMSEEEHNKLYNINDLLIAAANDGIGFVTIEGTVSQNIVRILVLDGLDVNYTFVGATTRISFEK